MRISVKGRYALASLIYMAQNPGGNMPVINISAKLNISKIYLEQIFSLLKKAGLVRSVKGAQGGYLLNRDASEISVFDVFSACEASMFEKAEDTVSQSMPGIEKAMRDKVFEPLDGLILSSLKHISLKELAGFATRNELPVNMFYI